MNRVNKNRSDLPDQFEPLILPLPRAIPRGKYPLTYLPKSSRLIWIILRHSYLSHLKPGRIKTCKSPRSRRNTTPSALLISVFYPLLA